MEEVKNPRKSGIPVLYIQHGTRSGGTRGILDVVLYRLLNEPGIKVLIGRKDFRDLRPSIMETFFEIAPPNVIVDRNSQEHRYVIQGYKGTSTLFFRELKDISGLGSQDFGCISVHEAYELTRDVYRTLKIRASQAGYVSMILMEGNAPRGGHWLDNFTDPKNEEYDPDIKKIILPIFENWKFLPVSYRASLEAMPDAWKRRYLLGETAMLPSGTPVYPSFVESVHVQDTNLIPDRPVLRMWDFGLRRAACVWGQQEDSGRILIQHEWLALETPEEQFIDGVIVRTNQWYGDRTCRDMGDPAARNRDPNGVSTLDRLNRKGISLVFRQTTYGQRIPLINRKFCEMIQGMSAVVCSPSCGILVEGLSGGYHYPELKEGQAFTSQKDIPFKDGWFEHVCNAFEYGMVNLFSQATSASKKFIERRKMNQRRAWAKQGAAVF